VPPQIPVFIFIAFLQQRQHSVPKEYEALYHLHSVIDMHKVSKQEISFTPVTLIHAQVGFFAPRVCSRFKHSDFQGRVPYTNTKCDFFKGLSLESVADKMEFLNPSNDKLGHLNKSCKGICIYKIPGGCF